MSLISKPYSFSAGATIIAAEHNSNFDTLYNLVNGNIDNDNVKASAAIAQTKLDISLPNLNVKDYGATGNGTTDDTAAIQSALDVATANSGGTVYIPHGTYKITSKLTIGSDGVIIQGESKYNTKLYHYTDGQDCIYASDKSYTSIRDLQIYDTLYATTRATGHAINLATAAQFTLQDVYIIGFQDGVHVEVGAYSSMRDIRAVLQKRDSYSFTGLGSTGIVFDNVVSSSPTRYCFYGTYLNHATFNSVILDNAGNDSCHLENCNYCNFHSCSAENAAGSNLGNGFYMDTCTLMTFSSITISKAGITNGIYLNKATRYNSFNNIFASTIGGYGIYVDNSVSNPYYNTFVNPRVSAATSGNVYDTVGGLDIKFGQYRGTLAVGTTASVWGNQVWATSSTIAVTDLIGGYIGQQVTILAEHAVKITDGTNFFLSASTDFMMASGDTLTLIQKADGNWYELGRGDN